jgi:hypothetical protein
MAIGNVHLGNPITPPGLGPQSAANSFPVVFANDMPPLSIVRSWTNKLRYVDMNASSGGIARGSAVTTTWTDVYSYTGSGLLAGFILNIETFSDWKVRLIVDSTEEIFDTNGITSNDMATDSIYDVDDVSDVNQAFLGLSKGSHDRIVFTAPTQMPIKYTSKIEIKLARLTGAPSKKFQAGLVVLSKDT